MSKELMKLRRSALLGSAATLLASFALGAGATGAYAQDQAAAKKADGKTMEVEEVVVTGSRIVRKDLTSTSPLSVTSAADVKLSGFTRIEDVMNSLPQVEAAQNSNVSNGSSGTASLDLRGMGPKRTLVLVNGRRLQPGGVFSSAPDVNQIPASLVKRVEVITGGASATYGADAVAGVVNYVMDNDFQGVKVSAGIAGYQHNNRNSYIQGLMDAKGFDYPTGNTGIDGKQYNIDIAMGGDFDGGKGHATVYATWRKDDELLEGARDYSSCALSGNGSRCGGSGTAPNPNFYFSDAAGNFDFNNRWTLDSNSNFVDGSSNVYNYAPINHFQRPDERWSMGAFVNYEINEHFKPFMEFSYMRDMTKAQIAQSGSFYYEAYNIDYNSPLLSDAQRTFLNSQYGLTSGDSFQAYVGKRNVEGGPRVNSLEHNSFRVVAGVEGSLNDSWSYNTSFEYGSTTSSSAYQNDWLASNLKQAIEGVVDNGDGTSSCAAGSTSGCIPYHVFTYNGVDATQANQMAATGILQGITKEYVANAYVTGDLGVSVPSASDTIQVVLGAEYRKEVYERLSDYVYEQGLLLGQGGPTASVAGSYNVKEIFGEARVPLVQDATAAKDLSLELAGRYSDYNLSGSAGTYKIALSWTPIDEVTFNASYNRAVRAPNVIELFIPQTLGLWPGSDPCSGTTPVYTAAQCANTGVSAAQYGSVSASPASQYNGLFGGNPDLTTEKANTWSFGVLVRPTSNMTFRVDYWDIDLKDTIGTASPADVIDQCATTGEASFCDLIHRNAGGNLWLGQSGYIELTNQNLGRQHLKGLDVLGDWETPLGEGTLSAKLQGTYMIKKEITTVVGVSAPYECAGNVTSNCFPQPKWRHSLKVAYDSGSFWTVQAKWRYYSSVKNSDGIADVVVNDKIGAQSYFDLSASFDATENVSFFVGVNNIFDKEPPLVGGSLLGASPYANANTFAGFYDTLGRYMHANMTVTF